MKKVLGSLKNEGWGKKVVYGYYALDYVAVRVAFQSGGGNHRQDY